MAHRTSRMPEPGPGDISPYQAPSGRDPMVQTLRCCFRSAELTASWERFKVRAEALTVAGAAT
jgi:hypothetical protein